MEEENPKQNLQPEYQATRVEHEEAQLAFLIDLIISDTHFGVGEHLKNLISHSAAVDEDVEELSHLVQGFSDELKLPPRVLSYALLQWFSQSDISPSTAVGSANWTIEAPYIGFDRRELLSRYEELHRRVHEALTISRNDPEECLAECQELSSKIQHLLDDGNRRLQVLKGRRRRLFYSMSKVKLKAFYLCEIRGLNLDSGLVQELLAEADAPFDLRQTDDRTASQKQLYGWCRSVRDLMAMVEADLGTPTIVD